MTPVLEAVDLSAGYGPRSAVHSINLRVNAGEIVALLGPNGAGKTTTLMALAGELPAKSGQVSFKGTSSRSPLYKRARQGLAYVTEERSAFMTLSVQDNLRLGRGPVARSLALFPELTPLLRKRAGLLSGGEQKMLVLARALAGDPVVLLVDEMSLGLAPIVVDRLLDALRRAAADGAGILLVEQQVHAALGCASRAYVLRGGEVVLEGACSDLLKRMAEIEASYLTQVNQPNADAAGGERA